MRRILCLSMILVLLISCFNTFSVSADYEYEDYQNDIRVLKELGILDADNDYSMIEKIKKKDFVNSVLRMADDVADYNLLKVYDINENLSGYITQELAVKYIVNILGYRNIALLQKGGYRMLANKLGILDNLSYSSGASLTNLVAVRMIKNALEADVCDVVSINTKNYITYDERNNILSVRRDIYKVEGRVTANEHTSLADKKAVSDGMVEIEGIVFRKGATEVDSLLGRFVSLYVYDDGENIPEIITLIEKEPTQKELVVTSEDLVDVSADLRRVKYADAKGKIKSISLERTLKVIYNGVFYKDVTDEDFKIDDGHITFLTGYDSGYDVAIITSYKAMWVSNVTKSSKKIYGKYSGTDYIEVNGDSEVIFEKQNGEEGSIDDINLGNVLSVAKSKDGEYTHVIISDNVISGRVEKQQDQKYIVNGVALEVNPEYAKALQAGNSNANSILIGMEYDFYLDYNNRIVGVDGTETALQYVLLYQMKPESGISEEVRVKYKDENDIWHVTVFADKIKYKNSQIKPQSLYNAMLEDCGGSRIKPCVARVKFNKKGEISEIHLPQTSESDGCELTCTEEQSLQWMRNSRRFSFSIYVDENTTPLFVFPATDTYNEDDYFVAKPDILRSDYYYPITGYNCDDFGIAEAVSTRMTNEYYTRRGSRFIIKGFGTAMDSSGSPAPAMYCSIGSMSEDYVLCGATEDIFSGFKIGDMVICATNNAGLVVYAKKDYSLSNLGKFYFAGGEGYSAGIVENISFEKMMVKVDCGSPMVYKLTEGINTQLYDKTNEKLYDSSVFDIEIGDELYIEVVDSAVDRLIIVRQEVL